jgi:hypothetical protein
MPVLRATIDYSKPASRARCFLAAAALIIVGTFAAIQASAQAAPGDFTTRGAWAFKSAPRLHPPRLLTLHRIRGARLAAGDFLLDSFPNLAAPGPMTGQGGPLIVDQNLQPVWFQPIPRQLVSGDLQQETYQGQPVLVWWQGTLTPTGATKRGRVVVVNQHYRRVATLVAQRPWKISLHDAVISGGAIWVTVYRYVANQNLTRFGGHRRGTVYDAGVQEYDLRTGKLLYTWDALNPGGVPHVPLSASEQPASTPTAAGGWDAYHVNSIQVLPGNQLLVSMRNTWAAYLIDIATGKIIWTLGGKHSSFRFGRGAAFAWQHDVRMVSSDEVSMFDDGCCRLTANGTFAAPSHDSRGLVLRLDFGRRTAALKAAYPHRPRLETAFLGGMQQLPGGNALVGWGSLPFFSEDSPSGRQLLDVRLPGKDQSYRAGFTSSWVGAPAYPPAGAARRLGRDTVVYASWNGATQVTGWQVLGGPTSSALKPVGIGRRTGFETTFRFRTGGDRVFAVRALNAAGQVLGTSPTFR